MLFKFCAIIDSRNWFKKPASNVCCIFRPPFGCCALQTQVKIVIFSVFNGKKLKSKKFAENFAKNMFFLSLHQNAGRLFYSQKIELFSLKNTFLLIKSSRPAFWCKLKKTWFFAEICSKFLAFFQHLECPAPKRWSKYTTNVIRSFLKL